MPFEFMSHILTNYAKLLRHESPPPSTNHDYIKWDEQEWGTQPNKEGVKDFYPYYLLSSLFVLEKKFLIFLMSFGTIFTINLQIHIGIQWLDRSLLDKRDEVLVFLKIIRETKREQRK